MKKPGRYFNAVLLLSLLGSAMWAQPIHKGLEEAPPEEKKFVNVPLFEDLLPKAASKPVEVQATTEPKKPKEHNNYNQLSLSTTYQAFSISDSQLQGLYNTSQAALADYGSVNQSSFQHALGLGLEYQRFGIFLQNLSALAALDISYARNNASASQLGATIPVTILNYGGTIGLAYRLRFLQNFYLQPFARGGMGQQRATIDFANSNVVLHKSDGSEVSTSQSLRATYGRAEAGLRLGFYPSRWLAIELGGFYQRLLFEDDHSQAVHGLLNVGYRL